MRKRILVVGSLLLLNMAQPLAALAAKFSDVPDTHKNAFAIQVLKDAGLVSGYDDSTFKPDQPVSRAEALAMVLKTAGIAAAQTSQKIPFTDVAETDWFFPMVQKGAALGKLKGYEDKTFRPNNPVTLPEALAIALSFFQVDVKKISVEPLIYEGLNSNEWYSKHAQYAKNNNLIEPDWEGRFDTTVPLTRGQLAGIIHRMREVKRAGKPFDITAGWTVTEHLDNFWRLRHPADWEIFKGQRNSALWKRAEGQAFLTRVWPTSARLSISLAENADFAKLKDLYKKSYPAAKPNFSEFQLAGRPALKIDIPERRILDLILKLPNGNALIIYGDYGEAPIGEWHKKQLEAAMMSYQYVEPPPVPPPPPLPPLAERMETLRENILVENKWNDMAWFFPDKKLIHTDAIGIGTGPVDYYYSAETNHTIKLERGTETVLNIKEGETNAF